jgi:hypothetical protein
MSWEITIKMPEEEGGVGHITAEWTDPDTALGVFTHSRNARVSVAAADAFIAEAIALRDAWQVTQAAHNAKTEWALERLNTADPKVVT